MTKIEEIFWSWAKEGMERMAWKPTKEAFDIAEYRMLICHECPKRKKNKCTICSCNLAAKTFSKGETCPKNKW